jgi:hypothetical protein
MVYECMVCSARVSPECANVYGAYGRFKWQSASVQPKTYLSFQLHLVVQQGVVLLEGEGQGEGGERDPEVPVSEGVGVSKSGGEGGWGGEEEEEEVGMRVRRGGGGGVKKVEGETGR